MRAYLQQRDSRTVEQYEIAKLDSSSLTWSDVSIRGWHTVDGLPKQIAQFETVFWEPDDTTSLRQWLSDEVSLTGSSVLEIGTGTGIVAIHTSLAGAWNIVATDINPNAVANAKYNAMHLNIENIEFRLVSSTDNLGQPGPFTTLAPDEQFDLIISNPPWEDAAVSTPAAYALYDTGFALLDGFINEADNFLRPGGQMLLAYGAKTAIRRIHEQGAASGWKVETLDDRQLDDLPEVFLPAMLLRLTRAE